MTIGYPNSIIAKLGLSLLTLILIVGCGSTEPTATPLPATATQVAVATTHAPRPPTATPAPPTATAVPPTPTDTPPPPPTSTPLPTAILATATPGSLLLLENSPQPFGRTETFQAGLGDLDGDGDLDAVFANMAANDSQVWFNDGQGTFQDFGQKLTQQGHGLSLGDLDGDGDLDVFVTCAHYGGSGRGWNKKPSRVYLNDGQGRLQDTGQDLGDTDLSGNGVNLVDVDGDGDLDAHVIYYEVGGMADRVYLNDGAGRFSDSGLALEEEEIAWGDLDGDGDVDMLAKVYGQGYRAYLNDGAGRFDPGWQVADSQAMYGDLALADFDGDGDLDALIASGFRSEGSFPTRLLWNDGGGQFTDSGQALNETMAARFAVGDLDWDGNLDVFVSNMDLPGEVWLNDGAGRLVDSGLRLESPSRHLATWPSVGDLDGDGDLDVVVAGFRGKVEVWINGTALPPRGGEGVIAFYSERTGDGDIYVMDSAGSNPKRVTTHGALEHWPSWSPDGRQIAFVSTQSGNADIYVINADGTNRKRLTTSVSPDWEPAWSPSGDRIAFSSQRDGDADIYVMNADGSAPVSLTHNNANDAYPSWSPDATKIAFCTDRDGVWEIYVLDVDGTDEIRITRNQANDWVPVWSPDGSKIVFTSERDGDFEIYIMNADGSNQTRMTNNAARDMEASWSPDGSHILFNSNRSGNHEIYIMEVSENLEPGEVIKLTENEAEDDHAVWSPKQSPPPTFTPTAIPTESPTPGPLLQAGATGVWEQDDSVMVYVPAGTFWMGSTSAEIEDAVAACVVNGGSETPCRRSLGAEGPRHEIYLDAFWIDRTEVTNAQYRKCVEAEVCEEPTTCDWGAPTYNDDSKADHPAVCVDWNDARTYCQWAGKRLPTEAQWEKAARGTDGRIYPWGDTFDGRLANFCDINCELGHKNEDWDDGYADTAPVGSYPGGESPYGAWDMAGNVWEWVSDWYGGNYYSISPNSNPSGPDTGTYKVLRGGAWNRDWDRTRAAQRRDHDLSDRASIFGFRCAAVSPGE